MTEDKENESLQPVLTWDELARYTIGRLVGAVFSKESGKVVLLAATLLTVGHLVFVWSLPKEDRLGLGPPSEAIVQAVGKLFHSPPYLSLGWVLSFLMACFFIPVSAILWTRIQRQGRELAECRDRLDPDRVTSRDEKALTAYEDTAKARFGGENHVADND